MFEGLKNKALKAAVVLTPLLPMVARADDDPGVAAFATLTTKVTTYGGLAFALAVVGTGIWIGIDLFKKGAKKGAK